MIDLVVYGLLSGAIFAMASFGFSLVLGVLGIVNMAHGVYLVLGGLGTHVLVTRYQLPIPLAIALAVLGCGLLASTLHKVFVERVFRKNPLMVLVLTFGLSIVMVKLLEKTAGAGERLLRIDLPGPQVVEIGSVLIPTVEIAVFAIAIFSTAVLLVLLNFTDFGRSIRACRDNPRSAAILGVNVPSIYTKTMFLCGAWTGLAGALLVGTKPLAPYMHLQWTVDAFLIVIIGGLGSMPGVLLASFLYGTLNYLAFYYFPSIAPSLIFGALILLLLFRPQGIFGLGAVVRK
jgi:branched-chain amino acid transport system permease protein